jgi:predicted site-specific integrase-resolvase
MAKKIQDSNGQFLDVNPYTIRRWAQLGRLKDVKIGSHGDWRFTKDNLLQMIKKE